MRNLPIDGQNLGTFSQNQVVLFQFLKKRMRDVPLPPSSYTPVVIKACRILLLTKFTIVKLKTDVFSVSTNVLCVGGYQLLLLQSTLYIISIIKRKCKTAFSTMFRTMTLRADVCIVFLIFISINQQLFHLALCTQICLENLNT